MKNRNGFVSNSSSSSFVIKLHYVSDHQVGLVEKHMEHAKAMGWGLDYDEYDRWDITAGGDTLEGGTSMDNFDMKWFLEKIGVPMEHVTWGDF